MRFRVFACSDRGCVRLNNEDNFYVSGIIKEDVNLPHIEYASETEEKRLLFAVCDGMGGEVSGERASLAAVKAMSVDGGITVEEEARINVSAANAAVNELQAEINSTHSGTTLAAFAIDETQAIAYNLGDSRVYMCRDGELCLLTHDHTMASYLVDLGIITVSQAEKNSSKNSLMKYVGMDSDVQLEPYFSEKLQLRGGDAFLLCSDGLYGLVDDETIRVELASGQAVESIGRRLMTLALEAGGLDNVTVIVIQVQPYV